MKLTEQNLDMTQGPIFKKLLLFAVPVFFSGVLQQIYVLVDTLIVSAFIGDSALASISNCLSIVYFVTAFFFGAGMGASIVSAQAVGARKYEWLKQVTGTGVWIGLLMCFVMAGLGLVVSKPLLELLHTPEDVFASSLTYLTIVLCGCGPVILYNLCEGILRSTGDARTPLFFLIFSTSLNIILDLLTVAVLGWGIAGAAFATIFSQGCSALLIVLYFFKADTLVKIRPAEIRLNKKAAAEIMRMGIPGGIENAAVSLANTVVQGFVNSFGSHAMAATGAFASVEGIVFIPVTSFCMALGTFSGQNTGSRNLPRLKEGVRKALFAMVIASFVMGAAMLLFAGNILSIFIHDPQTMEFALTRARITLIFYPVLGLTHGFSNVFRGAGKPVVSMTAFLGFWGAVRVLLLWTVLPFWHSYLWLCLVYPITWTLSTIYLMAYYRFGNWFPTRPAEADASDEDEDEILLADAAE